MIQSKLIHLYKQLRLRSKGEYFVFLSTCLFVIYYQFFYKSSECSYLCPYKTILTENRLIFDDTHFVEHFAEFICPQNFRNLADWIYGWPSNAFDEKTVSTTTDGQHIAPCLPSGSIIYVKTDYLDRFFRRAYPNLISKFVLITGQGDASSPNKFLSYLNHTDSKIIHWFGQNADITTSQSNKFTPVPIGINCYEMANAIRYIHQKHRNDSLPSVFGGKDEPRQYSHPLDISRKALNGSMSNRILLLNFDRMTDPTGFRSQLWKVFCNHNITSSFTKCINKSDGVHISILPTIYDRNRQYPFWLSPHGNGLDCHRTWEAFYLDIIPIIWNSTLNPLFVDLPLIILDDWKAISEEFLRTKLQEIATKKIKSPNVYRFDKLRFSYWRRLILSKSKHSITTTQRKNQCWRAKTTTKIN